MHGEWPPQLSAQCSGADPQGRTPRWFLSFIYVPCSEYMNFLLRYIKITNVFLLFYKKYLIFIFVIGKFLKQQKKNKKKNKEAQNQHSHKPPWIISYTHTRTTHKKFSLVLLCLLLLICLELSIIHVWFVPLRQYSSLLTFYRFPPPPHYWAINKNHRLTEKHGTI